jgi:hypothetical protein
MSQINIAGDTSGSIAVVAPLVAGSNTITLPASTGTVLTSVSPASDLPSSIKGPAFSAYLASNQNLTASTFTKVTINTEEFDTNSNFDSTTNYRFTPTVAGYYQVNGTVNFNSTANNPTVTITVLYKNGSLYKQAIGASATSATCPIVSCLVYLNGTTDYIELYAWYSGGSGTVYATGGAQQTYFSASMVRSA